jgi:non-ribosomal peptide synthetase component E (peptide arylation enzyme)
MDPKAHELQPFKKRDRDELLAIIEAMAETFRMAAAEHKQDAVEQIRGVQRGNVADMNEAIHRSVQAIALMKLASQLQEIVGIAEGRRSAARWLHGTERRVD